MPDIPTEPLMLKDFAPRSELITDAHPVERARFRAIDAHNHVGFVGHKADAIDRIVAEMDACNVMAVFDLDGNHRMPLTESLAVTKKRHPGRFYVLTVVPWQQAIDDGGDLGRTLAAALKLAVEQGADGLKVHKTLGLKLRDASGKLIMPDDTRLAPLWDMCAELHVPCLIHVADPLAFFKPLDRFNERYEELIGHPSWHFCGGDLPTHRQLMDAQERLLERHPDTVFQSAHVASCAEDLGYVASLLDRYPNLHVDIGARDAELGRQPHTARRFCIDYADRILYGTDVKFNAAQQRIVMRMLETSDEYFPYWASDVPQQGRWHIYGLGLPDDALRKIYYANAQRLYGDTPRLPA